jgi:hypothetical protein
MRSECSSIFSDFAINHKWEEARSDKRQCTCMHNKSLAWLDWRSNICLNFICLPLLLHCFFSFPELFCCTYCVVRQLCGSWRPAKGFHWKRLNQHHFQCTVVHFVPFLSGGFITAIVVNLPEWKLAKRTSVQCVGICLKILVIWYLFL